jgi:hypothetical protein
MDQFGFYQVGNRRFYSKIEAITEHDRLGLPIRWNFNDEVYSSYNWQVEPAETLEELYRQQAQRIRDQYDYVVLWFSGGADSSNILNSFINNNIKLDEVASCINYEATKSRYDWLNGEIFNVADPKVQHARLTQPELKHTVVDFSQFSIDYFTNKESKFDWFYYVNFHMCPNAVSRVDIKLSQAHWRDMIAAGKRVGFIHGIDKPLVHQHKSNYYFNFIDLIDSAISAQTQILNRAWDFNELFYWSADAAKIVIKQSHVIKRYMKLATPATPYITTDAKSAVYKIINDKKYYLTLDGIHRLIYPDWYPVLYQVKPPSAIFSPRDTWFFNLPDNDPAKYSWRTGLDHMWQIVPNKWKKDPTDLGQGIQTMPSKVYNLGS